jgi:replicative DNA helicase
MADNKRNQPNPVLPFIYGKVPPQNSDAEAAVLGVSMLEKDAFTKVSTTLRPEHFYSKQHQLIFQAIMELSLEARPIDILTVTDKLKMSGNLDTVGGPYYIYKLTNDVVSSANMEDHAQIIVDKFIRRELIRLGSELVNGGYSEEGKSVEEMGGTVSGELARLLGVKAAGLTNISSLLVGAVKRFEEDKSRDSFLIGYNTGYQTLNRLTYGWQPGDLVIVAARPSVGKTAFALNLARNLLKTNPGAGVGIFSLEMTAIKLTQRLMAIESGTPLEAIMTGRLSEDRQKLLYTNGIQKLAGYNLWMDDESIDLLTISGVCTKLVEEYKCGVIIIDYLQLMTNRSAQDRRSGNREQEISSISRGLKLLAKKLKCTIIALSQLSRAVESRGSKEPNLSDLRESGAIEQDADMVAFLWREDYQQEEAQVDPMLLGAAKCKFAKNRNGKLDTIPFKFTGENQRWEEDIYTDAGSVEGSVNPASLLKIELPPAGKAPEGGARLFIQPGADRPVKHQRLEDVDPEQMPF